MEQFTDVLPPPLNTINTRQIQKLPKRKKNFFNQKFSFNLYAKRKPKNSFLIFKNFTIYIYIYVYILSLIIE